MVLKCYEYFGRSWRSCGRCWNCNGGYWGERSSTLRGGLDGYENRNRVMGGDGRVKPSHNPKPNPTPYPNYNPKPYQPVPAAAQRAIASPTKN